ncbi:hypothetical protein B5K06_30470 [Rhizobium grahamii]|uniref:TIGR02588 family protein n=2 Tax=Rhizobium grahamii TaxID=1120045 RepID=A0A370KFU6_9HYPH|nr:hypothetical protein B5K06_30470 [Rhizobium grahamii]
MVEWIVGVGSTLLVLIMIGFVGLEVFADSSSPQLSITLLNDEPGIAPNEVRFEVRNSADTTAAAVVIRGHLGNEADPTQISEVTFDYVPAHSKARGALIFATAVAGKKVAVRAAGYSDP